MQRTEQTHTPTLTTQLWQTTSGAGLSKKNKEALEIDYLLFQLEHTGTIEIYGMQLYPSQVTFLEYCLWRDNQTDAITEDADFEILN